VSLRRHIPELTYPGYSLFLDRKFRKILILYFVILSESEESSTRDINAGKYGGDLSYVEDSSLRSE
jgi:hypothetical protein